MPIQRKGEGEEIKRLEQSQDKTGLDLRTLVRDLYTFLGGGISDNKHAQKIHSELTELYGGLWQQRSLPTEFFDKRCKDIFAVINDYGSYEKFENYSNQHLDAVHKAINTFLNDAQRLLGAHSKKYMDAERHSQSLFMENLSSRNKEFENRFMAKDSAQFGNVKNLQDVQEEFHEMFNKHNLDPSRPKLVFEKQCRHVNTKVHSLDTGNRLLLYFPNNPQKANTDDEQAERRAILTEYRRDVGVLLKTDESVQEMHFFGKTSTEPQNHLANITDAIMEKINRTYA